MPRKQLDLARRVKEKHSYVARDFDAQVRTSDQPANRQAIDRRSVQYRPRSQLVIVISLQSVSQREYRCEGAVRLMCPAAVQVEKLGKFGREKVDVMKAMRGYGESQPTLAGACHSHRLCDPRDVTCHGNHSLRLRPHEPVCASLL